MALRARPTPMVNAPTNPASPPPEFYADEFVHLAPAVEVSDGAITITADAPPVPEIDETHLTEATRAELAAGRQVADRQKGRQQAELDAGREAIAAIAARNASLAQAE